MHSISQHVSFSYYIFRVVAVGLTVAVAIALAVYHCICYTILFQERCFIPHIFKKLFES